MTISLRSYYPTASTSDYRTTTNQFDRWPEAPRYCASCGCRLRTTNRARICDPCDTTARIAHDKRQAWLHERGLL